MLTFVCASDPVANKGKYELKIMTLRRNESLFGGAEMMRKNPLLSSQSSLRPVYCYHQTPHTVILTSCLFLFSQSFSHYYGHYTRTSPGLMAMKLINVRHNLHSRSQSIIGIKTP